MTDPNAPLRSMLAAALDRHPSPPLGVGSVVRWRSARTSGLGQIAAHHPDGTVTVRTWLPARTHTVTLPASQVTHLTHLTDLVTQLTTTLEATS